MFWMGPGRAAGLFLLPAIAGLAVGVGIGVGVGVGVGAMMLAGEALPEGVPGGTPDRPISAYVDGKPVRSYVVVESI